MDAHVSLLRQAPPAVRPSNDTLHRYIRIRYDPPWECNILFYSTDTLTEGNIPFYRLGHCFSTDRAGREDDDIVHEESHHGRDGRYEHRG